jgi:hypothetical protein
MEQSENITELAQALSKAQAEIKNPAQNQKHTHFKMEYADLTAVLNAIRPVASRHSLAFTQAVETYNNRVAITTQITHSSGQWQRQVASLELPGSSKNIIQDIGSIATYMKRYQAISMWAISAETDTDAQELTVVNRPSAEILSAVLPEVKLLIDETNSDLGKFLNVFKVNKIEELSSSQVAQAVRMLREKKGRVA